MNDIYSIREKVESHHATLYGPEGEQDKGLAYRVPKLEIYAKAMLWLAAAIGFATVTVIVAAVANLVHFGK